ncbi:MAG: hypothetical protein P1U36_05590 [Legionellaceae bacterium]|nr:hypothetical protein [Legionellaceae bacterium]
MLTHKQTYYLQTMGIEPWVMRRAESSGLITVVMSQPMHDARQKKLCDAMFRSIGVSEDMLDMVYNLDADKLKTHVQQTQPRVMIALGSQLEGKIDAGDQVLVITMHHPADLLQNPHHKKEAYHALGRVASCLMQGSNNKTPV